MLLGRETHDPQIDTLDELKNEEVSYVVNEARNVTKRGELAHEILHLRLEYLANHFVVVISERKDQRTPPGEKRSDWDVVEWLNVSLSEREGDGANELLERRS